MSTYIVKELQNANSHREGYKFKAVSIQQAKRIATQNQVFQGTVLKVCTPCGSILAHKENGKWIDVIN